MKATSKEGKGRGKILRVKDVTRRIVGMYRLLKEEVSEEDTNNLAELIGTTPFKVHKKDWVLFKSILHNEVENRITNPETMSKIIEISDNDTGSLGDILFSTKGYFPRQQISIRFGVAMENAIRNFLNMRNENSELEFRDELSEFCEEKVQLDLANRIGDTIVYSELKYNFNLDTEKVKALVSKLDLIKVFFQKYYKNTDEKGVVTLVSLRYPTANDIPKLKPGLEAVRDTYILGYKELFDMFKIKVTEDMWKGLHKEMELEIYKSYKNALGE